MNAKHIVIGLSATLTFSSSQAVAQSSTDSLLKGIVAVDAHVELAWDERITQSGGPLKAQVEDVMIARFTLELRKLGLQVTTTAPNSLACRVNVIYREATSMAAYSYRIILAEPVTVARTRKFKFATVWEDEGVATVGRDYLASDLENRARLCAESFGNAWLSANPRRSP